MDYKEISYSVLLDEYTEENKIKALEMASKELMKRLLLQNFITINKDSYGDKTILTYSFFVKVKE